MSDAPTDIRARQGDQVLELAWGPDRTDRLPYLQLRARCPCAACQDEWTGARILDPGSIRPDLKLEGLEAVGSYAVRLVWNDGHGSGLYTWKTLQRIANETAPSAQAED